ncbi:hypothetical protein JW877_03215 [bacterium]|nr:hypothetical protein [bacterium]
MLRRLSLLPHRRIGQRIPQVLIPDGRRIKEIGLSECIKEQKERVRPGFTIRIFADHRTISLNNPQFV